MTKWISIKEAAEKYGTAEEKICSLIRHRYITFSYVDDSSLGGNYRDKLLMVSDNDLEEALALNIVPSLKLEEDQSIVRIPFRELDDILQANDHLREVNKSLLFELEAAKRREAKQDYSIKELIKHRPLITSLYSDMLQKVNHLIHKKKKGK